MAELWQDAIRKGWVSNDPKGSPNDDQQRLLEEARRFQEREKGIE